MIYRLIFLIFVCLLAYPTPPVIVKPNGGKVIITWPQDGRVAEIKRTFGPFAHIPIQLQVIENNCFQDHEIQEVIYAPTYRLDFIAAVWIKNPVNPNRVGKVLQRSFGASFKPVVVPIEAIASNRKRFPSLFQRMPPAQLHLPIIAPSKFYLAAWLSEKMIKNPETGIDENMIVSGSYEVTVESSQSNHHIISDEGLIFSLPTNADWPLIGDVISWQAILPDKDCSVAFQPKLSDLDNGLRLYRNSLVPEYVEFLWGNRISDYIEKRHRSFFEFGQTLPVTVK